MGYRDEREASKHRLAFLEQQAARVEVLERRVAELEAENRALRSATEAQATGASTTSVARDIVVDDPVRGAIAEFVRVCGPGKESVQAHIKSLDRELKPTEIETAAIACARKQGRGSVLPEDVLEAAQEVLRPRVALTANALSEGLTVDVIVQELVFQAFEREV